MQQLVGLLILVFAKASASTLIHDVATTYVGTGTMGIGNKGAAAVRLRCALAFVCLLFVDS